MRNRRTWFRAGLLIIVVVCSFAELLTAEKEKEANDVVTHAVTPRALQSRVLVNNSVWDCLSLGVSSTLFVFNNQSLVLQNVTFRNCPSGALLVNSTGYSSGVSATTTLTLTNVRFLNNVASAAARGSSASASTYGGGLIIVGSVTARVTGCAFIGNAASFGAGMIFTTDSSSMMDANVQLDNCTFTDNEGQGALVVDRVALVSMSGTVFASNSGGSAVYLNNLRLPPKALDSVVYITNVSFTNNLANNSKLDSSTAYVGRSGGALYVVDSTVDLYLVGCSFTGNSATRQGGAVVIGGGERTTAFYNCTLSNNTAGLYGGALFADNGTTVEAQTSNFAFNSAPQGGAIVTVMTATIEVVACNLTGNQAAKFGGAISAASAAGVAIFNSSLLRNSAQYAGALECWTCSNLELQGNAFQGNKASGSAGAVGISAVSAQVTLRDNLFLGNTAKVNASITDQACFRDSEGVGGALCAMYQAQVTLLNNNFTNNNATTAGAMYVSRQCEVQVDDGSCEASSFAIHANNTLARNLAVGGAGGAVYAVDISSLTVYCKAADGTSVEWAGADIPTWPYGTTGCPANWIDNGILYGGYGAGLATGLAGVRRQGNSTEAITNYSSGTVLTLDMELYDAFGTTMTRGSYETDSTSVSVDLTVNPNLQNFVGGAYSNSTRMGLAAFNSLKLTAPPGTYNLTFYAAPSGSDSSNSFSYGQAYVSIQVRNCWLGELMAGDVCVMCSGTSFYTFNYRNNSCDNCPDNALCLHQTTSIPTSVSTDSGSASANATTSDPTVSGAAVAGSSSSGSSGNSSTNASSSSSSSSTSTTVGYLVPEDGYWHSSPFSPQIHECPYSDACTYTGRGVAIGTYQEERLTLNDLETLLASNGTSMRDLRAYMGLQCAQGYTGTLCTGCDLGYGWRASGACYLCPPRALNTLYYCLSYLVTIALLIWTIRSTLTRSLGEARAVIKAARKAGIIDPHPPERSDGAAGGGNRGGAGGDGEGGGDGGGRGEESDGSDDWAGGGQKGRQSGSRRPSGSDFSRPSVRKSASINAPGAGAGGGAEGGSRRASARGPSKGGSAHSSRPGSGVPGRSRNLADIGGGSGGNRSTRQSDAASILELAAAAAMAQLEAEAAARGGRGGRSSSDSDDEASPGRVLGADGGFFASGYAGGGYAGGGYAVDLRQPSVAPLPKAALPGMQGNSRVPRSVRARESRLANSSSAAAPPAGGGGVAAGTDAGQGEPVVTGTGGGGGAPAGGRHRLARVSNASRFGPLGEAGPVAERLEDNGQGAGGGGGEGEGAGWSEGVRRRKPAAAGPQVKPDGGWQTGGKDRRKGGDTAAGAGSESDLDEDDFEDAGSGSGRGGRHNGSDEGRQARLLASLEALKRRQRRLQEALERQEVVRDEKPPHTVVLKILVNYIQVTSVVRNLSLDFPDSVVTLFDLGSMFSSAITTFVSLDCSLSDAGLSLALQRTVISVSIPLVIIALAAPVWLLLYGIHAHRRRRPAPLLLPSGGGPRGVAEGNAADGDEDDGEPGRRSASQEKAEVTQVVPYKNGRAGDDELPVGSTEASRSFGAKPGQHPREADASATITGPGAGGGGGGAGSERDVRKGHWLDSDSLAASALASPAGKAEGDGPWAAAPVGFNSYMATRLVVTAITVIFYFYPTVTDSILSVLQCEQLDVDNGAYREYLQKIGFFWELDYRMPCFERAHLVLTLALALPGVLLFCLGVPLASALWLRHNAVRGRLNTVEFSERYGFLYEDYRRQHYYWESVVMFRKLLVVVVLLVTNSSSDVTQVQAVLGAVLVAGVAQLYCSPYSLDRMNGLEVTSLGGTIVVLYLCSFFLTGDLTDTGKQALSILIVIIYVGVIAWLVYCIIREAWSYAVRVLDTDGDGRVSKEEVRQWLRLTLGSALAAIVAWIAEPRKRARRRQRRPQAGAAAAGGEAPPGPQPRKAPPPPPPRPPPPPPRPPPPPPQSGSGGGGVTQGPVGESFPAPAQAPVPSSAAVVAFEDSSPGAGARASRPPAAEGGWIGASSGTLSGEVPADGVSGVSRRRSLVPQAGGGDPGVPGPVGAQSLAGPGALPGSPLEPLPTRNSGSSVMGAGSTGPGGPRTTAMLELVVHPPANSAEPGGGAR